jgi:hypothetical protein
MTDSQLGIYIKRFLRADKNDRRFMALFAALLLYAALGEPTPDSFGRAEIIIGLLLIYAASHRMVLLCTIAKSALL